MLYRDVQGFLRIDRKGRRFAYGEVVQRPTTVSPERSESPKAMPWQGCVQRPVSEDESFLGFRWLLKADG